MEREGITITAVLTTIDWRGVLQMESCIESLEGEADAVVAVLPDEEMADSVSKHTAIPVKTKVMENMPGLSETRNIGAGLAETDVVAFVDDDVEVEPGWGDALRVAFRDGSPAAGGPAVPAWEESRPAYLPQKWDWLVGCGPYHGERTEVRNTYGCNIAFDRDVFESLGGFNTDYGFNGDLGQGEEAELCNRMKLAYGQGTEYMPEAKVHHRVPAEKAGLGRLVKRAWAQGVTKARLGVDEEETGFVKESLSAVEDIGGAIGTVAFLAATGSGYTFGRVSERAP